MVKASKLPVDTKASAEDMAEAMFGSGIEILTADYTGAASASGIYSDGDDVAPDLTPSDTGVILSTGKAAKITNSGSNANKFAYSSTNHRGEGDEDLTEMAGMQTYDAAVFEASFVPEGSTLTMQVTFASEEYLEYVGSGFNDAVGVYVNGEKAELMVGDGDITIDNINDESNSNLYIDNPASADTYNTEMDGFTVTLTLKAPVNPGEVNTIKIGIADAGDGWYDSNLLIAGESLQTTLVAEDDSVTVNAGDSETLDVLANDSSSSGGSLTITHINNQRVEAGDTITLSSGEEITLTKDGTFEIAGDGDTESNIFSYTVTDAEGITDTAFVTVNSVACFVAGTLIETSEGPRPVEALEPGDRILTRDHGAQPLRWKGETTVPGSGRFRPIFIAANTFGDHGAIEVSPNHRILIASAEAELCFGEAEVLVAAKHLVNEKTVRPGSLRRDVHYVHLLFDRHEVVCGNGLPSESYHPGDMTLDAFDQDARAEILSLFPNLSRGRLTAYGPTARPALKAFEARLLAPRPDTSRAGINRAATR